MWCRSIVYFHICSRTARGRGCTFLIDGTYGDYEIWKWTWRYLLNTAMSQKVQSIYDVKNQRLQPDTPFCISLSIKTGATSNIKYRGIVFWGKYFADPIERPYPIWTNCCQLFGSVGSFFVCSPCISRATGSFGFGYLCHWLSANRSKSECKTCKWRESNPLLTSLVSCGSRLPLLFWFPALWIVLSFSKVEDSDTYLNCGVTQILDTPMQNIKPDAILTRQPTRTVLKYYSSTETFLPDSS